MGVWAGPKPLMATCLCTLVDLASVLTPEIMAPILANADVQERLLPYLPSGESLPQTAEEIQNTLTSPQFQQVDAGLGAPAVRPAEGALPALLGCPHASLHLRLALALPPVPPVPPLRLCSDLWPFLSGSGHVQRGLGLRAAGSPHVPVWPPCGGCGGRQQGW